jgi:prevent-host-death family protein
MDTTISATELSRRMSDILNRVKYGGERFVVQRNGESIALLQPADLRPCANREWVMACGMAGSPSGNGSRPGE